MDGCRKSKCLTSRITQRSVSIFKCHISWYIWPCQTARPKKNAASSYLDQIRKEIGAPSPIYVERTSKRNYMILQQFMTQLGQPRTRIFAKNSNQLACRCLKTYQMWEDKIQSGSSSHSPLSNGVAENGNVAVTEALWAALFTSHEALVYNTYAPADITFECSYMQTKPRLTPLQICSP